MRSLSIVVRPAAAAAFTCSVIDDIRHFKLSKSSEWVIITEMPSRAGGVARPGGALICRGAPLWAPHHRNPHEKRGAHRGARLQIRAPLPTAAAWLSLRMKETFFLVVSYQFPPLYNKSTAASLLGV